MKFTQTLPILAFAVNAAPTSNQQALSKLLQNLLQKAWTFFQNLANEWDVGVDVQSKVDQIGQAVEDYYNANQAAWQNEFQTWMSANGYDTTLENWSTEANKIRNRNKNKTPAQILDALTKKVNGLTKNNVQHKALRKNLVAITKSLNDMGKNAVNQTAGGSKKAKQLWRDAATMMEAKADEALAAAQAEV